MKRISNDLFFAWVESEIADGRSVRFRLKGNSMFPLLCNGKDDVILYPCQKDELKPMDVVLFRYRGGHVLHRILYREGNRLMIQGDGSYVAKEECLVSDVVGIVRTIVRPSGKCILVDSSRWQLSSRLWRGLGVFRPLCLRILHLWHHNRMRISW